MVSAACEDQSEKNKLYDKISDMEMEADQLRRDMVDELTKRDVYPNEREDFLEEVCDFLFW